eukprot:TRINITY_DN46433_c0_g1_i1.p1 TRINITY_DN46433_c0_g1~~TRINITY_DN46433_c0_g1_i1.p1  ORF type:complete len:380 (-),score=85.13 TRINITY_DN46433_c0_g1_i1:819-1958(-)
MAPSGDASVWSLTVEVANRGPKNWTVWTSVDDARAAACAGTRGPLELKQDAESGFNYFQAELIRQGTVSLDEIDAATEVYYFTWTEEVEKAGLGHLSAAKKDASVKAFLKDGKLAWETPDSGTEDVRKSLVKSKAKAKARTGCAKPAAKKAAAKEMRKDIWGTVYRVPGQKIGAGSYHFESDKVAYVNYETMPPTWKLSDGSPYPARLDFENMSWDAAQRNFKGTINWTVSSKARWEYDLYFDANFIGITGTCKMYRHGSGPDAESYCNIRFGKDAKYVIKDATEAQIEWYYDTADLDSDTKRIIQIMGEVVEKDAKARAAAGRGKANATEALGLIFGQSMQTFARDKKADSAMMGESFPMRTGAKLGAPTRWDRTPKG